MNHWRRYANPGTLSKPRRRLRDFRLDKMDERSLRHATDTLRPRVPSGPPRDKNGEQRRRVEGARRAPTAASPNARSLRQPAMIMLGWLSLVAFPHASRPRKQTAEAGNVARRKKGLTKRDPCVSVTAPRPTCHVEAARYASIYRRSRWQRRWMRCLGVTPKAHPPKSAGSLTRQNLLDFALSRGREIGFVRVLALNAIKKIIINKALFSDCDIG